MFFNNNTDSKNRLKDISHHFLGNPDPETTIEEEVTSSLSVTFLPVLLESDEQDAFVYGVNNFFNAHGKPSMVVNVDSALKENLPVENKSDLELTNQVETNRNSILRHIARLEQVPDICLLPFVSSEISLLRDRDFLLVVVPASLKGVRKSFHHIEDICKEFNDITIGIVVINANSLQMSQLCFDVIRNSLASFLGLNAVLLGHLLSDTAIELSKGRVIAVPDSIDQLNSAPIELEDIARSIWEQLAGLIGKDITINNLNPSAAEQASDSDFKTLSA